MIKPAASVLDLIGATPIVRLNRVVEEKMGAAVYAKLESFNPGGSVKDRIALSMVRAAENAGHLKAGGAIVEPTSGNTGVGLAMVAAALGYRLILTMPDTMSEERRNLLGAYGAELVLTPGKFGMRGAIEKAEEIVAENPGYYMPQQFQNPANPAVHRQTTAQEIIEQMEGNLNAFVAGIGTGGTVTGVGSVLKQKLSDVQIVGVEPKGSAVLTQGQAGPHKIQGIGAGFVPEVLEVEVLDQIITVTDEDAYLMTERLAKEEGLLVGVSAGAACWAALKVAAALSPQEQVVVLFPDTGTRYLSVEGLLDGPNRI